jgi:hypothetical protein
MTLTAAWVEPRQMPQPRSECSFDPVLSFTVATEPQGVELVGLSAFFYSEAAQGLIDRITGDSAWNCLPRARLRVGGPGHRTSAKAASRRPHDAKRWHLARRNCRKTQPQHRRRLLFATVSYQAGRPVQIADRSPDRVPFDPSNRSYSTGVSGTSAMPWGT